MRKFRKTNIGGFSVQVDTNDLKMVEELYKELELYDEFEVIEIDFMGRWSEKFLKSYDGFYYVGLSFMHENIMHFNKLNEVEFNDYVIRLKDLEIENLKRELEILKNESNADKMKPFSKAVSKGLENALEEAKIKGVTPISKVKKDEELKALREEFKHEDMKSEVKEEIIELVKQGKRKGQVDGIEFVSLYAEEYLAGCLNHKAFNSKHTRIHVIEETQEYIFIKNKR